MWGLWAEVSADAFARIVELWSDPNQSDEPPLPGELANVIPSYRETLGLPLSVHLTGPTSRPRLRFTNGVSHAFVQECENGVDAHRAAEWNKLIEEAP